MTSNIELNDESLWSDLEAAAFLKLAPGTLRKARMSGNGPPYIKVGALVRYLPSAVQEWCVRHTRVSTAAPRGAALCFLETAPQPSIRPVANPGPGSRPGYNAPPRRPRGRPRKVRADTDAADGATTSPTT
jgi:hypothetical protein